MRAFILAAGFGTRLKPITDHIPKALVSVGGKPLLERALSFCKQAGIEDIGVNAHHLHRQIKEYRVGGKVHFELFIEDGVIRGTGGGLYFAREFLAEDDLFFVCNADILYQFDLSREIAAFKESEDLVRLLAVPASGPGTILFDTASNRFAGTPKGDSPPPGAAGAEFIGAALYRREFLDLLAPDDFSIVPVWQRTSESGRAIVVTMVTDCYWRDVGTPASLAEAHFEIIDTRSPMEVADWLVLDYEGKRCHHRELSPALVERMGAYTWVETADVPEDAQISRCIILAGTWLEPGSAQHNTILTPFGGVPFGK
jgi:NDP-sugar pyrophosphorylase family protein